MTRGNPFDDVDRLFDRLNEQLEDAAQMWETDRPFGGAGGHAVDVEDAADEFVVTVDLPGFDKDDVDVHVQDRTLTVSADAEEAHEEGGKDSTYIRRERRKHSFSRTVSLPEPVDPDGVSARLENGVLTVRLEKAGGSGGHRIDVE